MGLKNNCYATIWRKTNSGERYVDLVISTTVKHRTGVIDNDFYYIVKFIGKAFEKIKGIDFAPKAKIHLLEVEVKCKYNKTTKQNSWCCICWDCELISKGKIKEVEILDTPILEEPNEYDLPF